MLILLLSCGRNPQVFAAAGAEPPKELGVVGLAEPVFVADWSESPFDDGVYVGNVVMAGGYVTSERGDYGMQRHSKEITLTAQSTYREQAAEVVATMFETGLTEAEVTWRDVDVTAVEPERRKVRGTHPQDGSDNVNLPRFQLMPQAMEPTEGVDTVLVPYVVRYYSHNAGWFYGQQYGCGSGARMRILWVLYDGESGAAEAWRDVDVRAIEPYVFSPSSAEIEDVLIEAEALVRRDLDKRLF